MKLFGKRARGKELLAQQSTLLTAGMLDSRNAHVGPLVFFPLGAIPKLDRLHARNSRNTPTETTKPITLTLHFG